MLGVLNPQLLGYLLVHILHDDVRDFVGTQKYLIRQGLLFGKDTLMVILY